MSITFFPVYIVLSRTLRLQILVRICVCSMFSTIFAPYSCACDGKIAAHAYDKRIMEGGDIVRAAGAAAKGVYRALCIPAENAMNAFFNRLSDAFMFVKKQKPYTHGPTPVQ